MKIAVEGCCHGELDKIYDTLEFLQKRDNITVDLLLVCGDFQAVRNMSDLKAMAVPAKFQELQTFHKYYSGEKTAPILTIIIGGNHEASNYLQELPYGGWVAPNIYYLGYAGVVQFGGVRIAGMSGIYKPRDYARGHYEHPPYNDDTKRSCYHIRSLDVFRLRQLKKPIDIFLSHDWPEGIYNYGDREALLRRKPFFRAEVESGTLGSRPAADLLHALKPDYWFSAHLHVKFSAIVGHGIHGGSEKCTKFLALDKCLPRRQFLQIIDVTPRTPQDEPPELYLDPEWLCVLRSTNHLTRLTKTPSYMPGPGCEERYDFSVTAEELATLSGDFEGRFRMPRNFVQTAPTHQASETRRKNSGNSHVPVPQMCINPQTSLLCEMVGLIDPFAVFSGRGMMAGGPAADLLAQEESDTNDSLDVDDRDEGCVDDSDSVDTTMDGIGMSGCSFNPDEISIDDAGDDEEENNEDVRAEVILPSPPPSSDSVVVSSSLLTENIISPLSRAFAHVTTSPEAVLRNESATNEASSSADVATVRDIDATGVTGSDSKLSDSSAKLDNEPLGHSTPVGKTFKRRNFAVYAPTDDE